MGGGGRTVASDAACLSSQILSPTPCTPWPPLLVNPTHPRPHTPCTPFPPLLVQCQEPEPRLPLLLKLMLWSQQQLDERAAYPRVTDLSNPQLSPAKKS